MEFGAEIDGSLGFGEWVVEQRLAEADKAGSTNTSAADCVREDCLRERRASVVAEKIALKARIARIDSDGSKRCPSLTTTGVFIVVAI